MSEIIFFAVISILVISFLFERILEYLNIKSISPQMPAEARGIYDEEKYRKMMEYQKVSSRFDLISSSFSFVLMMLMLLFGGFAFVDNLVRSFTENPIMMAILFFGIIGLASDLISEPFSLYSIFVIEERFGFNKTTLRTYILDKLKSFFLALLLGVPILAAIVWFYQFAGSNFWIYVWILLSLIMVLMTMFYTSLILPLFNKLKPLAEGDLRKAIEEYAQKVQFRVKNIFVIDGSKRSTKANAFFSGLGAKKKIVLYDTLIEKHTNGELVAVLAHEVGHNKKKHTLVTVILSIIQTGLTLFIFSLVIDNKELSASLGADKPSFHVGAIVFGILYAPVSFILGIAMHIISRKNEIEADDFARETSDAEALQSALKKLSVDNLSNLTPHPWYVFFHYSHPPLLARLKNLDR